MLWNSPCYPTNSPDTRDISKTTAPSLSILPPSASVRRTPASLSVYLTSFLAFSAAGHAGGACVHDAQPWAQAGLRGARSRPSKSRGVGAFRGIALGRVRARQDEGNPTPTKNSFSHVFPWKTALAPRLVTWPPRAPALPASNKHQSPSPFFFWTTFSKCALCVRCFTDLISELSNGLDSY